MDLKKILNQPDTTIIDVRERLEFLMGHVNGAINIPLGKVPSHLEEIKEMDKPIVLYCVSGNRSGQATDFLRSKGIREVYNGINRREIKKYRAAGQGTNAH